MPKISAATAASRRSHILDAARKCFAEDGIHVSVDDICARAGISKGAFYVYFSSKDAAIEAVAQDHARVISAFAELDSVEALIEKLMQLTTGRSLESSRVEIETWTHALRAPSLRAALQRNMEGLRKALAEGVSGLSPRAVAEQRLAPAVVAEILTIFSMGLLTSAALSTKRDAHTAEVALVTLVRLLIADVPERRRRGSR